MPKCANHECGKRVLADGISACGKSWHAQHFVCIVCQDPLVSKRSDSSSSSGAPSFFEHHGEPYCADHHYEKFGERCGGCGEIIKTDSVFHALGQAWHQEHFCCVVRALHFCVSCAVMFDLSHKLYFPFISGVSEPI